MFSELISQYFPAGVEMKSSSWCLSGAESAIVKLAILVHQQFWYTFGWFFGTQKGTKTDGFQNGKFWGFTKLELLVH